MLARYRIHRGRRPPGDPLPDGIRQDTRKHTRHVLRPDEGRVREFLAGPTDAGWRRFERAYLELLQRRYERDAEPFERLAALARETDVYLGCSCPTRKNPDVRRCHTVLALRFMKRKYPALDVRLPS